MIDWKAVQTKLGLAADGIDGPNTYAALYGHAAGHMNDAIAQRGQIAAAHFAAFGMVTPERICEFIAQCCNETGGFTRFEENLNYQVAVMLRTWPEHFTIEQARAAFGNPVEIASRAYGGRMGNAPYPSQDGYTYRGRGDLQLTGRAEYQAFGAALGLDLVNSPDLASGPNGALIALQYFRQGNVNAAVDRGDFVEARRITNGGSIGLANVAAIRGRIIGFFA